MTYREFAGRNYVLFPKLVWENCHKELEKMTLEEYDELHRKAMEEYEAKRPEREAAAREAEKQRKKEEWKTAWSYLGSMLILTAGTILLGFLSDVGGPGFNWFLLIVEAFVVIGLLCV